jgi:hypothetical protein
MNGLMRSLRRPESVTAHCRGSRADGSGIPELLPVNSDCTDYLLVRPRGKRLGRFALDAQLAEGGRDGLLAATR